MEVSNDMKFSIALCLIVVSLIFGGWTTLAGDSSTNGQANVFLSLPTLPADLKRVVVLPLACDESSGPLADGCQMFDPVLRAALIKTGRFEVVPASSDVLSRCTGKLTWTGEEVLPQDFFESLRNVYGCDAVMFCQLSVLRGSPPLAIGWKLKLTDIKTGKILWAADEIFDAGNLCVAKDAQQFEEKQRPRQGILYATYSDIAWWLNVPVRTALDDQWDILHSPKYFGEYSAEKLLTTLPQR